jgi:hypothetical protein
LRVPFCSKSFDTFCPRCCLLGETMTITPGDPRSQAQLVDSCHGTGDRVWNELWTGGPLGLSDDGRWNINYLFMCSLIDQ